MAEIKLGVFTGKLWRERVGIEPTVTPYFSRGYEGAGDGLVTVYQCGGWPRPPFEAPFISLLEINVCLASFLFTAWNLSRSDRTPQYECVKGRRLTVKQGNQRLVYLFLHVFVGCPFFDELPEPSIAFPDEAAEFI
jgi:hypothetical protein